MKRVHLLGLILFFFLPCSAFSDGYILFVNRQTGVFDAPISLFEGDQSCLIASMMDISTGRDLFPRTTFQEGSLVDRYLNPVLIRVPNKEAGNTMAVQVRVYVPPGSSEESLIAQSMVFEVTLGTEEEPGIPVQITMQSLQSPIPTSCDQFDLERGDGHILFVNRINGVFDAPITFSGVWPSQQRLRAALRIVGPGPSQSLLPETNFRNTSEAANAYLHPVVVPVPGRQAGDTVSVQVEIYTADNQLIGQSFPFDVVLGTVEEPGIISGLAPMHTPGPPILEPCSTPPPLQLDVIIHGDHVMLNPHGLCENALTFDVEFSEDLVTWSVLPSAIRDTIVPERNRYYRIKTPPSASGN